LEDKMQIDVTLKEDSRITVDLSIEEIRDMIMGEDVVPEDLFSKTDLHDWAISNDYQQV